jgi:hypothetical protein
MSHRHSKNDPNALTKSTTTIDQHNFDIPVYIFKAKSNNDDNKLKKMPQKYVLCIYTVGCEKNGK